MIRFKIEISKLLLILFLCQFSVLPGQEIDSTFKKSLDTITEIYRIDSDKALSIADRIISEALKQEAKYEEDLATVYRQKAAIYGRTDLDSQKIFIHKSLNVSKKYENWKQYLMTTSNMAGNYGRQGEFKKADSLFQFVLNHPEFDHKDKNKIVLLLQYSTVLNEWQKNDKSILLLNEAMEISTSLNFHKYDMHIYNQIAAHYSQQNEPQKSIDYNRKILKLLEPSDTRKFTTFNNMANQFLRMSKKDSAKHYISKVLNGKPKESSLIFTYQTAANIAYSEQQYELGLEYSAKCIDISKKFKRWSGECKCNFLKARNIYRLNNFHSTKKILNSIKECTENMADKHQLEFKELEFGTELQFLNRPDLEEEFLMILEFQDSLTSNASAEKFRELETKYESEKKEIENQILKQDKLLAQATLSKQRSFLAGAGVAILSLLFFLWNLFKTSKERKKNLSLLEEKNEAITSLNHEIGHRTKNHLALATALLSKDRSDSSDPKVISALSENESRLRTLTLINQKLSNDISIEKLDLEDYLKELSDDLMFSFDNSQNSRSKINLTCDSIKLDSETVLRLGLITNELITNSFKHAKPENSLKINLAVKLEQGALKYIYSDNGIGYTQTNLHSNNSQGMSLLASLWKQIHGSYEQTFSPNYTLVGNLEIS